MSELASTAAPLLSIEAVSHAYGAKDVLRSVSLAVADGEFVTLLGPSGCGKTTLLRLIAGFERPAAGRIVLGGADIAGEPPNRRPVNTVFQSYALFPHMSVFENVAYGLRAEGRPKDEIRARVGEALAMVQLDGLEKRRPDQLSGGQQQRVALARAVVKRPRVLLLDEPLSALDAKLRRQMQTELKRIQRELGIAFLFVTHDQEEALAMSDRVVVMRDGVVEQVGTPREVYETPANLFVARFVGEINVFDGVVEESNDGDRIVAIVEGARMALRTRGRSFAKGARIRVLLRPEDMRLLPPGEARGFPGRVVERNYKGSTLDSVVRLESGKEVLASEFFGEDDPDFDHSRGEAVRVAWVPDWEWIVGEE